MEYGGLYVKLAFLGLVLMWSVVNWDMTELGHLEVLENWGKFILLTISLCMMMRTTPHSFMGDIVQDSSTIYNDYLRFL